MTCQKELDNLALCRKMNAAGSNKNSCAAQVWSNLALRVAPVRFPFACLLRPTLCCLPPGVLSPLLLMCVRMCGFAGGSSLGVPGIVFVPCCAGEVSHLHEGQGERAPSCCLRQRESKSARVCHVLHGEVAGAQLITQGLCFGKDCLGWSAWG